MSRTALITFLFFVLAASAQAQNLPTPQWELYGGYSEYLAMAGVARQNLLPSNGVQVEVHRVVTSYFRVTSQFNAQFADHLVNIAPAPPPGGAHVNSKLLLGLFGPEATLRAGNRWNIYGHFLMGFAYGRDNEFPEIPTATYTTWAYALGCGLERSLGQRVSARLIGFDWITTHFPVNSPEAQDNWRFSSGFLFHFGR